MSIHWDRDKGRWRYQWRRVVGGKTYRATKLLPAGWSRDQAEAFDQEESARLYAVATGVLKPVPMIAEAIQIYGDHRIPDLRSGKNVLRELAQMIDYLEGRTLDQLRDVATDYARDQSGILEPATIRNRLSYLRAAVRYAYKTHGLGDQDYTAGMRMPTVHNERHVFPGRALLLQIMRKMGPGDARAVLALAYYSGARWISEILPLTPDRIEGDTFFVPDPKNRRPHIYVVHPKALVYLRRAPFHQLPRHIYSQWQRYAPEGMRMHDLRHGFASTLIRGGATLRQVGEALNHSGPASTARYAFLEVDGRREVVRRLAGKGR